MIHIIFNMFPIFFLSHKYVVLRQNHVVSLYSTFVIKDPYSHGKKKPKPPGSHSVLPKIGVIVFFYANDTYVLHRDL